MRTDVSTGLQTEFDKQVTDVGYLMQINASTVMRWSNVGTVTYQNVLWSNIDFEITGLSFDLNKDPDCQLVIQNMDNTAAGLFLNEKMGDVLIDIYQFTPNALVSGDALPLVRVAVSDFKVNLDKVEAHLIGYNSEYSFSPRRRVDPYNGFNRALPPGAQIVWGFETFILQEDNSA